MGKLSDEIRVSGLKGLEILEALGSRTRLRILHLLVRSELDVSTIALKLGLTEGAISEEVKVLEDLALLTVSYVKGKHGIRKVCRLAKKRVCVDFE